MEKVTLGWERGRLPCPLAQGCLPSCGDVSLRPRSWLVTHSALWCGFLIPWAPWAPEEVWGQMQWLKLAQPRSLEGIPPPPLLPLALATPSYVSPGWTSAEEAPAWGVRGVPGREVEGLVLAQTLGIPHHERSDLEQLPYCVWAHCPGVTHFNLCVVGCKLSSQNTSA